jgi:hypothetical protein
MNDENITYLIFDKFCKVHSYNNTSTNHITINNVFSSLDYDELNDDIAIEEFNKFTDIMIKIPNDLDKELYKVYFFTNSKLNIKITIIGVDNTVLSKYDTINKIPNCDFLKTLCNFHNLYNNINKLDNTIGDIINIIKEKIAEPSDFIIENPKFLKYTLYKYQKQSIYWMLQKELVDTNRIINYGTNKEIYFNHIKYDIIKDEIFKENKQTKDFYLFK